MEGYKEFLDDIKSKLNNPLISSFLIGWLLWNWKIPLVLFIYDQNELHLEGAKSYIQFIQRNTDVVTGILLPGMTALFYTFVFPYIRTRIKEYHTRIITQHENRILELTKTGQMPIARYLLLKKDIDDLNLSIRQLHQEEAATKEANNHLEEENKKLRAERDQIENLKHEFERYGQRKSFDGLWDITYVSNGNHTKRYWRISNGTIWEGIYEDEASYQFDHLIADGGTRNLVLILSQVQPTHVQAKRKVFTLSFDSNFTRLDGQDFDRTRVILEKRKE